MSFNRFSKCCLMLPVLCWSFCCYSAHTLTGAGSTFIYPVLNQWVQRYFKSTRTRINYQPIGSGGGITQLISGTIDFAASDQPLDGAALSLHHWQQFPMVVGGIVPVVHIAGIATNTLVLSGPVLANIYMNTVHFWDDPSIKKLNPSLTLPHTPIVPVHRADGSGTTYNFTHYLSSVSPAWKQNFGSETLIAWPGISLGAKGNAGVANQVQNIPGSIGYVEYAYARQTHIPTVKLINSAQKIVTPDARSFASAASHAKWKQADHFNLVLTNQPGESSWPIVATTFILLPKAHSPLKEQALNFFQWCFNHGAKEAKALHYVPMPGPVIKLIRFRWSKQPS